MTITRFVAALSVVLLAACQGEPRSPMAGEHSANFEMSPAFERPPHVGPLGIDLAADTSNSVEELRNGRIDFVARYYRDPTSSWPALTAREARSLSSLGLQIVAVWEQNSPDPSNVSYASGYSDATAAYQQAKAIGQPPGSAIYFAIDFNADDLESVKQYFRGIAAALAASSGGVPEYKVGVYGSGAVCDAVKRAGLAQYAWLSNSSSWAGSADYNDWNIRQGEPLADLSFDNDSDEARGEYGGFRVAGNDIAAPDATVPGAEQVTRY